MYDLITSTNTKLHVLKNQLNLQFHLLLASWNPDSPSNQALFQDEHTSCLRWARAHKKKHLLEIFAFESTKAPEHLRPKRDEPKPISEAAARQAAKRSELTGALNNLIGKWLYLEKPMSFPAVLTSVLIF